MLKSGLEVVYERLLVNTRITSWHLIKDKFIYQDDENGSQIIYVRFYHGQVVEIKRFQMPDNVVIRSPLTVR